MMTEEDKTVMLSLVKLSKQQLEDEVAVRQGSRQPELPDRRQPLEADGCVKCVGDE